MQSRYLHLGWESKLGSRQFDCWREGLLLETASFAIIYKAYKLKLPTPQSNDHSLQCLQNEGIFHVSQEVVVVEGA